MANSPDGSIIYSSQSGANLTNSVGTWGFDGRRGNTGDRYILLNNIRYNKNSAAVELVVANGGKLYAKNAAGGWWQAVSGGNWISATDPTATPTPPPTSSPLTIAVTYQPSQPNIPPNDAPGSFVAKVVATRSDGQPFTGTFVFAPGGDYGGAYAITMNTDHTGNLIVNPTGPGVGSTPTIEHVQVIANQP